MPVCITYIYLGLELQTTTKALETERVKGAQLKRDMEGLRRKSITEQEKAARLVTAVLYCTLCRHNTGI